MDGRLGEGRDGTTVVVVGSINADLLVSVPRLPAPGETVIGGRFRRAPGGKGGNQAAAAARLGAQTWLVGCVGDDDLGREARQELCEAGVDTGLLAVGRAPTGVAAVITDTAGENAIAVASGANDELDADLVRVACAAVPAADAVVLACLEVPDEAVLAAAEVAAARGWPFVLNPAPARPLAPELLRRCAVLTPNHQEVTALGRSSVQDLLADGLEAVVVTRAPMVPTCTGPISRSCISRRSPCRSWTPPAPVTPSARRWPGRWPPAGRWRRWCAWPPPSVP